MNQSYSPNHVMNLSNLILPDDQSLYREIQMHINQLESGPSGTTPWLTLLQGLKQRGLALESESRSLVRHSSYAELCLDKLWSITGQYLSPFGYVISEWMTPGHPSYLILLPQSVASKCMDEAQLAGYGEIKLHHYNFHSTPAPFFENNLHESDLFNGIMNLCISQADPHHSKTCCIPF